MVQIRYGSLSFTLAPDESVLEGLERHKVAPANSCRAGRCQSCVMRLHSGEVPPEATDNLRETWRRRGYFLSCLCKPTQDLEISDIDAAEQLTARIVGLDRLSEDITRVRLELDSRPEELTTYEPGQFISLLRPDGLTRSYCLSNLADDGPLEFHVRWQAKGRMSTWIHREAKIGDSIEIRGPLGVCFYTDDQLDAPLLLIATGSGLGSIWGMARSALRQGHRGAITIIHGGQTPANLYLVDELHAFAQAHEQVRYVACVYEQPAPEAGPTDRLTIAKLNEVAGREYVQLSSGPVPVCCYVCGEPEDVKAIKLELFLSGLPLRSIISEAFVTANLDGKKSRRSA